MERKVIETLALDPALLERVWPQPPRLETGGTYGTISPTTGR